MENLENKVKFGVVYKITNLVNGKRYIGQTTQEPPTKRFNDHICESNKEKPKMVICKAIKEYGKDNFTFEVIDEAFSQEELNLKEGEYIKLYKSLCTQNGYNITEIIEGEVKHSEQSKERISIAHKTPKNILISANNGKKSRGKARKNSKSKYCGVTFAYNKWKSSINIDKKHIDLGYYLSEEEAAKAYDIATLEYSTIDSNLNFTELREAYLNNEIEVNRVFKIYKKQTNSIVGVSYCNTIKKWVADIKGFKSKRFKTQEEAENQIREWKELLANGYVPTFEKQKKKSNSEIIGVTYCNTHKKWIVAITGFKRRNFKLKEDAEKHALDCRKLQSKS